MASADKMQQFVCVNCKLRKKKCNKAQPRCGYCARKKLDCQYQLPGQKKHVAVRPELSVAVAPNPLIRSSLLLSNTLSDVLLSQPTSVESTLYLQVLQIIRTTNQSVIDIITNFYRGIYLSVPIISRPRLHRYLDNTGEPPPACFSILLLSICLITYHPGPTQQSPHSPGQPTLYLATKALFSQVQASTPPTLSLIQAGILIATYEYATGKANDAFTSIGMCARMGYVARLHLAEPTQGMEAEETLRVEEETCVWSVIMIYERTIACELSDFKQAFATQLPDKGFKLPGEPDATNHTAGISPNDGIIASDPGAFACLAQATYLLDQIFQTLNEKDMGSRYYRLDGLDHTTRTVLAVIMEQSQGKNGIHCTAIVVILRALIFLNCHALEHLPERNISRYDSPDRWHAAMRTIIKMGEDIIVTRNIMNLSTTDTLRPGFAYILRTLLEYMRNSETRRDEWDMTENRFEMSLQRFNDCWGLSTMENDGNRLSTRSYEDPHELK